MIKVYKRINWEDKPQETTPINAENLNKMDLALNLIDDRVVQMFQKTEEIPSKTSELENDSGYITKAVTDLVNYYKKSETYTQDEVKALISAIPKFSIQPVPSLPTTDISTTTVYLLKSGEETDNLYTEYIYVNGAWEYLGKQTVDLTGYVKRTELSNYYTIEAIDELINTLYGQMPTKVSQLENDSKFVTSDVTDKLSEEIVGLEDAIKNLQPSDDYLTEVPEEYVTEEELIAKGYSTTEYVDAEIADLKTQGVQQTPLFANSIEECTDTSKFYVLPDGYIYAYMEYTTEGGYDCTNLAGEILENHRVNSSNAVVANEGTSLTGYIPVTRNDVVRIKGFDLSANNSKLVFYNNASDATATTQFSTITYSDDLVLSDGIYTWTAFVFGGTQHTTYLPNNTYYLRVCGGTVDGEDIIVTINEEIVKTEGGTGYKWTNTGRAFVPTDYEDRIVSLEKNDSNHSKDIENLQEAVENLRNGTSANDLPDYWKTAIDALEDNIKEKLDDGGVDAFSLLWCADMHGSNGYTNTNGAGTSATKNIGVVAQYTTEKYNIPFFMLSGDVHSQSAHSDESKVEAEYKAIWEILSPVDKKKLLLEKGNHDGAWMGSVDGVYYLKNIGAKKIYNHIFRKQALDRNRVFGGDGSYYYVDTPQNIRIIMLNCQTDGDSSVDSNGYAVYNSMKTSVYGTEQLEWLVNVALANTDGKRIIVSAHQPLASSKDGSLVAGILEAYNNRTSYSNNIDVSGDYWGNGITDTTYKTSSVTGNFANASGKVVLYLHGHIHKDTMDSTTYSFVMASITTAGADVRDTNPPLRTIDTATETALDIVILTSEKISFIRLGVGEDREVLLT